MIAHSDYVWHIYCASIDIECLLLTSPTEPTLTPIAANRRKYIYILYIVIILVMCPLAYKGLVATASGNLDCAKRLNFYNQLILGLWSLPQLWGLIKAMLRIKRIIKCHNDCLQDTYHKIRLNIAAFFFGQITIVPYIIANLYNCTFFYDFALTLYLFGIIFVGLLLLYFISIYNNQAVNQKGTPTLIRLLQMKRQLDLSANQTRLDAIAAYRDLTQQDNQMMFDSLIIEEEEE